MKLSIVSTLYRSAPHIEEFHRRTRAAAEKVTNDFEIILVNDGSPDNSLQLAVDLSRKDEKVVVVDLSRNFGHHKAIMTGLAHARGSWIFLIDSDLEEEPECLETFFAKMEETDCDVVYGKQERRRGGVFDTVFGELYYYAFRVLSGLELPKNILTARLMTRRYVDALLGFQEREIVISGLWHITGFEQVPVTVRKLSHSPTTYNVRRKFALLVDMITSFSNAPLSMIFYLGLFIFCMAGCVTLWLIWNWAFFDKPVAGWTSVMVSVWILGGAIICLVGVVGIYLGKVYSEVKQRPYTIVRRVYGRD